MRGRLKSFAPLGELYPFQITKFIFIRPSCWDIDMLVKMIDAGMNVARLNFSHGDHKTHGQSVENLKEALK